jgi:hypothetical protein
MKTLALCSPPGSIALLGAAAFSRMQPLATGTPCSWSTTTEPSVLQQQVEVFANGAA